MFLEFDWTFGVYRPRFGTTFTDIRGERSYANLREARAALKAAGLKLGPKTGLRTWSIEAADGEA